MKLSIYPITEDVTDFIRGSGFFEEVSDAIAHAKQLTNSGTPVKVVLEPWGHDNIAYLRLVKALFAGSCKEFELKWY